MDTLDKKMSLILKKISTNVLITFVLQKLVIWSQTPFTVQLLRSRHFSLDELSSYLILSLMRTTSFFNIKRKDFFFFFSRNVHRHGKCSKSFFTKLSSNIEKNELNVSIWFLKLINGSLWRKILKKELFKQKNGWNQLF